MQVNISQGSETRVDTKKTWRVFWVSKKPPKNPAKNTPNLIQFRFSCC